MRYLEKNKTKVTMIHHKANCSNSNHTGITTESKKMFYKGMHIICGCFALILCFISYSQNWNLIIAIMASMSAFIAELMTLFMVSEANQEKVKEEIKILEMKKRIVTLASKEVDYLVGSLN